MEMIKILVYGQNKWILSFERKLKQNLKENDFKC